MRALWAMILAATVVATPASAVTNLIKNGSFEAGAPGTGGFTDWTKSNTPSGVGRDQAGTIIPYNSTATYPFGAYREPVSPDNSVSFSPDAVGNQAAYFVGDFSANETISQMTFLNPGLYRIGFSFLLTANGLENPGNSSFSATILSTPVATTNINSSSLGQVWTHVSGLTNIATAGFYETRFVFNSNFDPSKDIVIDRVYAVAVPEPQTWAMLIVGFGLVGAAARRRQRGVAIA
jgi:hypothetical protein